MRRFCLVTIAGGALTVSALCARPAAAAPIGFWNFSQASGQTVPDGTGNGYAATLGPTDVWTEQSPTLVMGLQNSVPAGATAASFNASQNQYVNISGGGGLNNLTTGTIGMWVDWTSNNQQAGAAGSFYGAVMGRQSNGNFSSDLIGLDGSDPNTAHIVFWGASSDPTRLLSITSPGTNQWHYLTITFSSSSQQLYLDGKLDAILNNGLGAVGNDVTAPLTLGAWIGDGNSYSNSMIRDVSIYDTALSSSEVANLAADESDASLSTTPEPGMGVIVMGAGAVGLLWRRRDAIS